jgi:hypothetical protein
LWRTTVTATSTSLCSAARHPASRALEEADDGELTFTYDVPEPLATVEPGFGQGMRRELDACIAAAAIESREPALVDEMIEWLLLLRCPSSEHNEPSNGSGNHQDAPQPEGLLQWWGGLCQIGSVNLKCPHCPHHGYDGKDYKTKRANDDGGCSVTHFVLTSVLPIASVPDEVDRVGHNSAPTLQIPSISLL